MKRIFHDYRRWEDYKNGMWRRPGKDEREELLQIAFNFTGNHIKYGSAMMTVIEAWKYSCEHNLTDKSTNQRAWIGHAACSLEMNLPECVVRDAWKLLTNEQRYLANKQADIAIEKWRSNYINKQSGQLEIAYENQN